MQSVKDLKTSYYAKLGFCIAFILMFFLAIIMSVFHPDYFFSDNPIGLALSVIVGIFSLSEIYLLHVLIVCLKDWTSVRKNTFEEITGTVIRYSKNEADTGYQLNNYPQIKPINDDKKITLLVNKGTEINGTYTFLYLKHTKIGVVKTND